MTGSPAGRVSRLLPFVVAATVTSPLVAQAPARTAGPAAIARLDSLMPVWLERLHVPGAAVAVVRKDTVLLLRGWGLADAERRTPVSPATVFRVASLSKLVTATAALRLAEEGRLDRHADVARYLETDVTRRFPGVVTLHHLLTHTAGFDLSDVGDAARTPEAVMPLAALVSDHPEPQVLPPGLAYHYSNFGFALVGHLVERASGRNFADYARENVFRPLGMNATTFEQPAASGIRGALATGHAWTGNGHHALPLDYTHVGPADALLTSAADMAAFMRFQLGHGTGVLSRAMRDTMQATQFTASPGPYGMAYAFQQNALAKRRVLQHAGAQLGFASFLVLSPDDDLGVFVAQNAREGSLRWNVVAAVFDALVDSTDSLRARPPGRPDVALDASRYAGRYRHTGYTHSTFEKATWILGLRGGLTTVRAGPEPGTLRIDGQTWTHAPEFGAHMFVHPTAGWWVQGFRVEDDGRATHYVSGREVLERVEWWQLKRTIQLTLIGSVLLSLATLAGWPLARRFRVRDASPTVDPSTRRGSAARRFVQLASLLWVAGIAGVLFILRRSVVGDVQFDYGPTSDLVVALTILQLSTLAVGGVMVMAILAWRYGWWSRTSRIVVALQGSACAAAIAALGYMNLLGYRW